MKWPEIKNQSSDQLNRDLSSAKSNLVDLQFKIQSGALKQVHEIKNAKKEIAMILTRIHQIKHNNNNSK